MFRVCAMLPFSPLHVWLKSCSSWFWCALPPAHLWLVSSSSSSTFQLGPVDYSWRVLTTDYMSCSCALVPCWYSDSNSGFAFAYCSELSQCSWIFALVCFLACFSLSGLWVPKVSARILFATVYSKPSGFLFSCSLCWISGDYEPWAD